MASAWELDIPSTEKMVLLCLCDHSNDEGVCWPSVPTIAKKCSKSPRTIQIAIRWLRDNGFCSWDDTPGKPHRFTLDPRRICTPTPAESAPPPPQNLHPAESAPPQVSHHTPAESAPEPSRTLSSSSEPKGSSPRAWALPAGVSLQVWTDLMANRKRKRLSNTPTAWKGFLDDLTRVASETGIPPPQLIERCTAKGWGAIYDPRDQRNERTGDPTTAALQRVIGAPC